MNDLPTLEGKSSYRASTPPGGGNYTLWKLLSQEPGSVSGLFAACFFFSQILLRRVQNFKWNQVVRWMNILRISRCEYFQSMCYWWFFSKTSFKWNHISKTWFILLRCSPQKWSLRSAVDLNSAASLTSCHLTFQILLSQLFYYNSIPIKFSLSHCSHPHNG